MQAITSSSIYTSVAETVSEHPLLSITIPLFILALGAALALRRSPPTSQISTPTEKPTKQFTRDLVLILIDYSNSKKPLPELQALYAKKWEENLDYLREQYIITDVPPNPYIFNESGHLNQYVVHWHQNMQCSPDWVDNATQNRINQAVTWEHNVGVLKRMYPALISPANPYIFTVSGELHEDIQLRGMLPLQTSAEYNEEARRGLNEHAWEENVTKVKERIPQLSVPPNPYSTQLSE